MQCWRVRRASFDQKSVRRQIESPKQIALQLNPHARRQLGRGSKPWTPFRHGVRASGTNPLSIADVGQLGLAGPLTFNCRTGMHRHGNFPGSVH